MPRARRARRARRPPRSRWLRQLRPSLLVLLPRQPQRSNQSVFLRPPPGSSPSGGQSYHFTTESTENTEAGRKARVRTRQPDPFFFPVRLCDLCALCGAKANFFSGTRAAAALRGSGGSIVAWGARRPSGRTAHPARPARFARALAGGAPSREGLARPSEARGEVMAGGGPKGGANPLRVPITIGHATSLCRCR